MYTISIITHGIEGFFIPASSIGVLEGKPYIGHCWVLKCVVKCIALLQKSQLSAKGILANFMFRWNRYVDVDVRQFL